jgi:hypothetical protein
LAAFNEGDIREFSRFMVNLAAEHNLPPMLRYDSRHFTALSNAEDGFSESRLRDCELMYELFYEHFSSKGFVIQEPPDKLMVALFDSQAGFEAYLGYEMDAEITGIYHLKSNRFVMYDFGQNRNYLSAKQAAERKVREIDSQLDRQRYLGAVQRQARDARSDVNVGTIMHEVAHQISFNCGLLNRKGDIPLWLAEGLACYCEATHNGAWQGIGEPNRERLLPLVSLSRAHRPLIPVKTLIESEDWLHGQDPKTAGLLYSESWALFSMLMEERPHDLGTYFDLVCSRRMSERRSADFEQAFGTSWKTHDRKLQAYVQRLVQQYGNMKR